MYLLRSSASKRGGLGRIGLGSDDLVRGRDEDDVVDLLEEGGEEDVDLSFDFVDDLELDLDDLVELEGEDDVDEQEDLLEDLDLCVLGDVAREELAMLSK